MTRFKAGDIVLIRFPFTDMETKKRRPVVIVNPVDFSTRHGDIVVLPLTGQKQNDDLRLTNWRESGLFKPTWVKPLIATITISLIEKTLGVISPEDEDKVQAVIKILIDEKFLIRRDKDFSG